jgi:hypothetical protein
MGSIDATVHAYLQAPDRRLWWVAPGKIPHVEPTLRPVSSVELTQLRAELAQGAPDSVATVR